MMYTLHSLNIHRFLANFYSSHFFTGLAMVLHNPWEVRDASLFLKYCCPECNHQSNELHGFAEHALENHELSKVLFDNKDIQKAEVPEETEIKSEPYLAPEDAKDNLDKDFEHVIEADLGNDNDVDYLPLIDAAEILKDDAEFDIKDEDEEDDDYVNDEDYADEEYYEPPAKKTRKPRSNKKVKKEIDEDDDFDRPTSNRKKKRQKGIARPDKDGWTKCEYCPDKSFLFVFELLEHLTESHGGERYVTFPLTAKEIAARDARLAESNWVCKMCDSEEQFQSKANLVVHWYQNHSKENYPYDACQWCMELFDSVESVLKHHEKVHPNLPKREYPCSVSECYHHGAELSKLAKHYKRHEAPYALPIKCNICDQQFIIEEGLLHHMKSVHSQDTVTHSCSECSMSFISETSKLIHESMHGISNEINSKYLCKYCLVTGLSKIELVNHCKENHEFETLPFFMCDKCDFDSPKFPITEEHYKNVHGMLRYSPFTCKHCDHISNELDSFRRHVITHQDVSHICDECGKVLKSKKYLKRHIEYHHAKQDRCVCDICGFSTSHQDWLKRHILNQHQKAKVKFCPHCKKVFRDKNCLEVHIDHNHPSVGEKKFFCQECGAGFMYQYSLTSHLYKHKIKQKKMNERIGKVKDTGPVQCPHCDKTLNGPDNLSRHITQSHKKLTCSQCQKTVLNKFQLKKHLFFDHGETDGAFLCNLCPEQVFFSKPTYSKHMQKAHSL